MEHMKEYVGNMREIWRNMWEIWEKYEGICGKYEGICHVEFPWGSSIRAPSPPCKLTAVALGGTSVWGGASCHSSNCFLIGLYKDLEEELRTPIQRHETRSLFFGLTKKSSTSQDFSLSSFLGVISLYSPRWLILAWRMGVWFYIWITIISRPLEMIKRGLLDFLFFLLRACEKISLLLNMARTYEDSRSLIWYSLKCFQFFRCCPSLYHWKFKSTHLSLCNSLTSRNTLKSHL